MSREYRLAFVARDPSHDTDPITQSWGYARSPEALAEDLGRRLDVAFQLGWAVEVQPLRARPEAMR